MAAKKALIIEPVHPVLLQKLDELGYSYTLYKQLCKADAMEVLPAYHGLITSNKLYVDKDLIDAGSQLEWIGRMGSGMEIIDVAYAQKKGIACINSPEGNANAVAEQALGMLLSLLHNTQKSHLELMEDIWLRDENRGTELKYRKVGIVGYGNNGSLFASKLVAMGCEVYAFDPFVKNYGSKQIHECTHIDEMLSNIDVLSFHVPLNDTTKHYFNDTMLNTIANPFYLLNLSRGAVVDLSSVAKGMDTGKILGAAIDVWEQEPITLPTQADYAVFRTLISKPNFIGTAHIGGYSHQATYLMSAIVADKIAQLHECKS